MVKARGTKKKQEVASAQTNAKISTSTAMQDDDDSDDEEEEISHEELEINDEEEVERALEEETLAIASVTTKVKKTITKAKGPADGKPKANLAKVMKAKGRNMKTGSVDQGRAEADLKQEKVNPISAKAKLLEVVLSGLSELDNKKGVSFPALKKYVIETNDILDWEKIRTKVKTVLEKGIEENLIIRPKGSENVTGMQGSFKINMKTYNSWKKGPEKEKPKKEEKASKMQISSSTKPKAESSSTKYKSEPSTSKTKAAETTKSKSLKITPKKTLEKKVSKLKHRRSISEDSVVATDTRKRLKKSKSLEQLAALKKSPAKKIKKATPKKVKKKN